MPEEASGNRVLGVVGSPAWDTIRFDDRKEPFRGWGGIGYAIEAFSASLDPGWEIRPLVKVGADRAGDATRHLESIPGVRLDPGLEVVDEPTNRVELEYSEGVRESERLIGGVPPWDFASLHPRVAGCDALYVNFISGNEMGVEVALALREAFAGPIWGDLHSLFLGVGPGGHRFPRPLDRRDEWLRAFDAIQLNEDEFQLLAGEGEDPWTLAERRLGGDLGLVSVTLGPEGAAYMVHESLPRHPLRWRDRTGAAAVPAAGEARRGRVPGAPSGNEGDSAGCGDVWGATAFARMLAGDGIDRAMVHANRMAARRVGYGAGAEGLHRHLAADEAEGGRP